MDGGTNKFETPLYIIAVASNDKLHGRVFTRTKCVIGRRVGSPGGDVRDSRVQHTGNMRMAVCTAVSIAMDRRPLHPDTTSLSLSTFVCMGVRVPCHTSCHNLPLNDHCRDRTSRAARSRNPRAGWIASCSGVVRNVRIKKKTFVGVHVERRRDPFHPMQRISHFRLSGGVGFCNAIRRSLLSDLMTEAPCNVRMRVNTTCFTDEFLSHRIGLVPFRRVGNGSTMSLDVTGPASVMSSMLVGPAFECVHDVEIARLGAEHRLSLVVNFDTRPASAHSRYSPCAAVGMKVNDDSMCEIRFRSNDSRTPTELISNALDHTDERLQRALHSLASQPQTPPQSYC